MSATLPGPLVLDPTQPTQAATKEYVDSFLHVVSVLDYGAKGDGTTDDTTAIQSTLNTYAGKGIVFVPDTGHPYMTSGLTLPSGTDLLLHGTIMLIANAAQVSVVTVTGASNVTIRGHGTIDGNGAAQTLPHGKAGLYVYQSNNVLVSGVTLQNAFDWPLNVVTSNKVRVDSIYIYGGGAANEFANGCNDCWITSSIIDGTGHPDYGFCFYGGVTNSGIVGCTVKNNAAGTSVGVAPGIGILSDTAQPAVCSNIVIADNIVYNNAGAGIATLKPVGGAPQTGIIIANNKCYGNSAVGYAAVSISDCYIDNSAYVTVIGNQFGSNGNASAGPYYGIYTGPTAARVNIIGNQISNVKHTSGASSAGMWVNQTNYLYVSGNYLFDDQVTPTMLYAAVGTAGIRNTFVNNYSILAFQLTWASDSVAANFNQSGLNFTQGRFSAGPSEMAFTNAAGLPRWYMGNQGNTESGSNSGSDWILESVNDAGAGLIAAPITVTRSTGDVTLSSDLTVTPGKVTAGNLSATNAVTTNLFAAWGVTPPSSKPTVTGAKGGNAALASLLTALASYGLVTDSTTA